MIGIDIINFFDLPRGLFISSKLKTERQILPITYLSLESLVVDGGEKETKALSK